MTIPETWTLEDAVLKLDRWQDERETRRVRWRWLGYAPLMCASLGSALTWSACGEVPWYNWLVLGAAIWCALVETLRTRAERCLESLAWHERRMLLALAREGR